MATTKPPNRHGTATVTLPSDTEILITRVFDAPAELIFFPDGESLNTVTLVEKDGVTTMTTLVVHSRKEHRDMHIQSGMEGGMQVSFNRLEDVVAGLHAVAA